MRRDITQESIDTEGWYPHEGKKGIGGKRVYEDAAYADLRKKLKIGKFE